MGNNLANTIKQIALASVEERKTTDYCTGFVIGFQPLRIQINDKLIVDEKFLVLSDSVRQITRAIDILEWETEETEVDFTHNHLASTSITNSVASGKVTQNPPKVTIPKHEHTYLKDGAQTQTTNCNLDTQIQVETTNLNVTGKVISTASDTVEYTEIKPKHTHMITGTKKMIIHNELKKGDKVALIKFANGQMYYVLGKLDD